MILVDSSYFIALANRKDRWHVQAVAITPRLEKEELVTTDLFLSEAVTGVGSLLGGKAGKATYDTIVDNCRVEASSPERRARTITLYLHYDGTLSFADALGVELTRELGIGHVASFDDDFDRVRGLARLR